MPRTMLIATLIALASVPAAAQETPALESAGTEWAACAAVAVDPRSVSESLGTFDIVFGKPALDWTDDDYNQLMELAIACDGTSVDGHVVDARSWHDAIESAKEDIFELSGMHQIILEDGHDLLDGRVPYCPELMTYQADDWALEDNSKDLFGESFLYMETGELRGAIEHINNCLGFLPEFAKKMTNARLKDTEDFVYQIMDKALFIQKRREDWRVWKGKRRTDVVVTEGGQVLPPTFLSPDALKLVTRYNRAASFTGGLSLDAVSALLEISDEVIAANVSKVDVAYANEIRRLVQKDIFDRTEHKLD